MPVGEPYNPYRLFVGAFLPNWLLERQEVSMAAKLVFARLAQFAGKDGKAYPAQGTLAEELGCSRRTVVNALDELENQHNLIRRIPQGRVRQYEFLGHEWMKSTCARYAQISALDQEAAPTCANGAQDPAQDMRTEENHVNLEPVPSPDGEGSAKPKWAPSDYAAIAEATRATFELPAPTGTMKVMKGQLDRYGGPGPIVAALAYLKGDATPRGQEVRLKGTGAFFRLFLEEYVNRSNGVPKVVAPIEKPKPKPNPFRPPSPEEARMGLTEGRDGIRPPGVFRDE